MTGRIVVGLDGSPNSVAAARWAVDEARRRHTALEVVTVFGLRAPDTLPDRSELLTDRELVSACTDMQRELLSGLDTDGVDVRTCLERGEPAHRLTHVAADADLLVLGARGHGGIADMLLGSVSLHCSQRAACPVAVIPAYVPESGPGAQVVAGFDGSVAGLAALRVAAEEARLRDVDLDVVHAVHWSLGGTDLVRPAEAQLVDWGQHLLERTKPVQDEFPDVTFETRAVPGHPAQVLNEVDCELLVIGSRGHGQLTGRLLGSVSLHLLTHARRPTVVVTVEAD